jgi:carboxyl-terminal processing protease
LGLELRIDGAFPVVVAPIDDSPAERAGLGGGDVLVAIDSVSTRGQPLPDIVKRLRGPVGSRVTLTISRKGRAQPETHELVRGVVRIQSVRWKTLVAGYGYIRVAQFQDATGPLVAQAFESVYRENRGELKGLILDLRDNSGGLLSACVAVAAILLPRGALIASINGRTADSTLRLTASPENYIRGRTQPDYVPNLPQAAKTVPMAVLVNGATASGSEMVATALQYHKRARVFGARTFENYVVATIFPLVGNTALKLTTARIYGPGGAPAAPVMPDVTLEQRDKYWRAYASPGDVQLAQALKLLGGQP